MKRFLLLLVIAVTYISCNDSKGSEADSIRAKEERNRNAALATVKAYETGKVDSVLSNAHPEFVDYGEGSMEATKGLEPSKTNLKEWMAAVPNYKGTDFIAVAEGDYVMVYGEWSGTWTKDFMGMKATGRSFTVKDVDIFKFNEEGKIIEHRSVQSNNEAARQLGMTMPSPTPQ